MTGVESKGVEWPAKRVRDTFMRFFEEKSHVYWKSSPVVPHNDPTLLFANAGSSPNFLPIFEFSPSISFVCFFEKPYMPVSVE